jgi:hypothetical protein
VAVAVAVAVAVTVTEHTPTKEAGYDYDYGDGDGHGHEKCSRRCAWWVDPGAMDAVMPAPYVHRPLSICGDALRVSASPCPKHGGA